jgi:pSer/pThr/pTyr-binding forkhead associated (FHA) protein
MEKAGNLNVLIFGGANGVQTLALNRESISIGRLPDQDLVLHASYVSRHHAVINRVDGGFELVDQGSTHGTWLNGLRVNRALLRPGDVIQFGSPGAPKARFESGPAQASSSLADELVTVVSQLSARSEGKRTSGLEMVQLNFLLSAARKLNAGGAKG